MTPTLCTLSSPLKFSICNVLIEQVSVVKLLGLFIDENLRWQTHIDKLPKKSASGIGATKGIMYMLWFNFILGLNCIFFCFKLIIIHYHTQKQKKIKFKPRIKLNHNIYKTMLLFNLNSIINAILSGVIVVKTLFDRSQKLENHAACVLTYSRYDA